MIPVNTCLYLIQPRTAPFTIQYVVVININFVNTFWWYNHLLGLAGFL